MKSLELRMLAVCFLVAACWGLATTDFQPLWGQEPADAATQAESSDDPADARAARRNARGRLPAYYTRVVSGDQREQIYKIQQNYEPKIQELLAQVRQLREKRDKEIDGVLTPEQLERVNQLRAEARERQQRRRQQQNAAASDQPAAAE